MVKQTTASCDAEKATLASGVHSEKVSLWLQFEKLVDLHKFYFEHLIKAASFSFGIVGAILTYAIKAGFGSPHQVKFVLCLPFLLSFGSFALFGIGCWLTWDLNMKVNSLQTELDLKWKPHSQVLIWMSVVLAILFLFLAMGIGWLTLNPTMLPSPPIK